MEEVERSLEPESRGLGRGDKINATAVFISPHPDLLPEGEGTFCLYGSDADSCPVCCGDWYRLVIHDFTDNPINVYETAVMVYILYFSLRLCSYMFLLCALRASAVD